MPTVRFGERDLTPSKIVCIGKNYVAHIEEMGGFVPEDMVVFMKPNSAIGTDLIAVRGEPIHYEAEICFLVEGDQFTAVAAGLDLTKRQTQQRLKDSGLPWERSKSFDGAALFSEFVALPDSIDGLTVSLTVDKALRQQGGVALMMYPPTVILSTLKTFLTLEDGDIVMTGTPAGVGPIQAGEYFEARILDGERCMVKADWVAR